MAIEETMTDYDMQNPKKKKKLQSMKKLGKTVHELPHKTGMNFDQESFKKTKPIEELMEKELPGVKLKPGSRPMNVEEGEAFLNGAKAEDIKSGKYKREDVMMAPSLRYATDEEIKESRSKTPAKKDLNDKVNNEVNSIFSEMKKSKLESLKKPATKKD